MSNRLITVGDIFNANFCGSWGRLPRMDAGEVHCRSAVTKYAWRMSSADIIQRSGMERRVATQLLIKRHMIPITLAARYCQFDLDALFHRLPDTTELLHYWTSGCWCRQDFRNSSDSRDNPLAKN
jgi:hypothetical protein